MFSPIVVQYFVISMLAKMLKQESSPIVKLNKMLWYWMLLAMNIVGLGLYIAESVGLMEESHVMMRRALIKELKEHRNRYIEVYASEPRYNYILDGLHPPKNASSFAPSDKWLTLPDM